MARIDHAAIRTKSYEEAQRFFKDVFEMHMYRNHVTLFVHHIISGKRQCFLGRDAGVAEFPFVTDWNL